MVSGDRFRFGGANDLGEQILDGMRVVKLTAERFDGELIVSFEIHGDFGNGETPSSQALSHAKELLDRFARRSDDGGLME